MYRFLKAFIDFILYSNLWIATAALAMAAQTQVLLSGQAQATPFLGFVLFATLLLYAVHRIVGLEKARPFREKGRYFIISRFKSHILLYAVLSAMGAAAFFFQLPFCLQLAAVFPSAIALGYVLPVLKGRRRLRDLSYIKIFLIAIAWSWITVALPAIELGLGKNIPMALMALERSCFIFAITLPFDIRDLEIDRYNEVKTLPAQLGMARTKALALLSLLLMSAFAFLNYHIDVYGSSTFYALLLSGLLAYGLIQGADKARHDYYFSGLIDGMMIVQFLLIWLSDF